MRNLRQFRPQADALEPIHLLSGVTFRPLPARPVFVTPQPAPISQIAPQPVAQPTATVQPILPSPGISLYGPSPMFRK